jgi:hypothetical protein
MNLHIRILWGLLDCKDVPKDPSDMVLAQFTRCFETEESISATQHPDAPLLIMPLLVKIGIAVAATHRGQIAAHVQQVEEHILEYVQTCLARFGLEFWCPDLRQSPYALYNATCRIIALDTFKQALLGHAYASLGPNISYAKDLTFLTHLYDHFVHHYMFGCYKKEKRQPGSIKITDEMMPQYQNCIRVRFLSFLNLGITLTCDA